MIRDENDWPEPASPLPWHDDTSQGINSDEFGRYVTGTDAFANQHDLDYAIHAANCFPKLVEALKAGKAYADALGNYSEHAGKVIGGIKSLDDLFEHWQEKQDAALEAAKGGDDAK